MGGTPLDRISIRDIKTSGRHGVSDEERREYQEFLVDIDIDTDATAAIESDDVSKTVDYSEVVEEASRMVAEESFNLIETLASGIANRILEM
ncbi:MAG: dihydroneopterin aldolase, partial [Actinomycetota bacterium]|nr:dihydroneopterin aldolase [Actinomycetota bacterium]